MVPLLLVSLATAGSVHEEHMRLADAGELVMATVPLAPHAAGPPTDGPHVTVYGYVPYWADDLSTLPWDDLSHIALFSAAATFDGRLTETSKWGDIDGALAYGRTYDVRIHLTVTNFKTSELRTLLGSKTNRDRLIDALAAEVKRTGVHGVNIDFEGLPSDRREQMVTFTHDLQAKVPEVVLATPAVDWRRAWDYAALTQYADLFIMGYGYHWGGSDYAGPVDPLYGGSPWAKPALDWTIADYPDHGARPERVIVGLPLYGYSWSTASDAVPAKTTARGSSIVYTSAKAK
ncbi:MAG: spore germination protein YaaH, partial [Kiritimatiellia bacterium]